MSAGSGSAESVYEFTIPMRGNEFDAIQDGKRRLASFTIPMRGNETVTTDLATASRGMFTIPMRGNESVQEAASEQGVSEVYDPHEG